MKTKCADLFGTMLVLLMAASAFSSTTRMRSMGDVGLILRDDANLWLFPSTAVRYRNLAILELGGRRELLYYFSDHAGFEPSGGGLIGFGADQQNVIGGFFGESSERLPFGPFDPNTGLPLALSRRIDLFSGMGKSRTSYGWQATYASGAYEFSSSVGGGNAINKGSVRAIGLAFGVTHAFHTQGSIDLAWRYENHSFDLTRSGQADEQPKAGHHFGFLGRWTKQVREHVDIVPFAGFSYGRDGRETGLAGSQRDDLSQRRILAGTGFNFRPDGNSVFSLGLSLLQTQETRTAKIQSPNSTTKQTQSTFRAPFVFGGIETMLFKWLQARFGFQKALQTVSRKNETTSASSQSTNEDKRSEGPFELTFGLGVHFRNLSIDLSLDPDYFKRGVYVLSGSDGDMFNLVTVTYGFD